MGISVLFKSLLEILTHPMLPKSIDNMKYKFSLIDIWDKINPEKEGNTWCDSNNNPKSRIDYIFFY